VGVSYLAHEHEVIKVTGSVRAVNLDYFAGFHEDGQSAEYQVDVVGEAASAVVKIKLMNDNGVWKVIEAKLIP
jgi:hypothetical protein